MKYIRNWEQALPAVPPYSCAVMRDGTKQKSKEDEMKIFVIAVIIAVMLLDTFLCWCLLRASSIESRKEELENAARDRRET